MSLSKAHLTHDPMQLACADGTVDRCNAAFIVASRKLLTHVQDKHHLEPDLQGYPQPPTYTHTPTCSHTLMYLPLPTCVRTCARIPVAIHTKRHKQVCMSLCHSHANEYRQPPIAHPNTPSHRIAHVERAGITLARGPRKSVGSDPGKVLEILLLLSLFLLLYCVTQYMKRSWGATHQ